MENDEQILFRKRRRVDYLNQLRMEQKWNKKMKLSFESELSNLKLEEKPILILSKVSAEYAQQINRKINNQIVLSKIYIKNSSERNKVREKMFNKLRKIPYEEFKIIDIIDPLSSQINNQQQISYPNNQFDYYTLQIKKQGKLLSLAKYNFNHIINNSINTSNSQLQLSLELQQNQSKVQIRKTYKIIKEIINSQINIKIQENTDQDKIQSKIITLNIQLTDLGQANTINICISNKYSFKDILPLIAQQGRRLFSQWDDKQNLKIIQGGHIYKQINKPFRKIFGQNVDQLFFIIHKNYPGGTYQVAVA